MEGEGKEGSVRMVEEAGRGDGWEGKGGMMEEEGELSLPVHDKGGAPNFLAGT